MLKVIYCLNVLVAVGGFQDVTHQRQGDPKVVAIQIDGVPKCLGAFVTATATDKGGESRFIATAAHCVYGVQASRLKINLGGTGFEGDKAVKGVKRVMVHPYYMPPSLDYDIALLKTDEQDAQPGIPLNKDPLPSGDLKAFKWEENVSKDTKADLEDRKSCRAKLANHTIVSTRMLCAHTQLNSIMDGSPLIKVSNARNFNNVNTASHIVGVGYVRGGSEKTLKIFTNIANSEIYSFIEKYVD